MPRGVKGSGNLANLTTPEARAKAAERMKANRPRMALRRLMKQIAQADTATIDAEIARLRAEIGRLEAMRDTINGLKGNGRSHAAATPPAASPAKQPAERIADYLRAAGAAKPATIAADLGLIPRYCESLLSERDDLFTRDGAGYRLRAGK